MKLLELAVLCIGGPVLAAWAHEFTHAAVVRLLGGRVHQINLWYLYVDFSFPDGQRFRETIVHLSPTIVGVVLMPVLLVLWKGSISPLSVMSLISWTVFSLMGGSDNEISIAPIIPFIGAKPS